MFLAKSDLLVTTRCKDLIITAGGFNDCGACLLLSDCQLGSLHGLLNGRTKDKNRLLSVCSND